MSDLMKSPDIASNPADAVIADAFRPAWERLQQFRDERNQTEQMIAEARRLFTEMNQLWDEIGERNSPGVRATFFRALKQYGPQVMAWIGGPAAGATVAAVLAEDGAFSQLLGMFSGLF